jgi:hypothetical protein
MTNAVTLLCPLQFILLGLIIAAAVAPAVD